MQNEFAVRSDMPVHSVSQQVTGPVSLLEPKGYEFGEWKTSLAPPPRPIKTIPYAW